MNRHGQRMTRRPLPPPLSPEQRADCLALLESALAAVQQIDVDALPQDREPYGPRMTIGEAARAIGWALRMVEAG